jgi:hypothetical protein
MSDGFNISGHRIPCRNAYCANNPLSRSHMGEVCDECEARERREDAENPRCSVCEVRKSEHGADFPCRIDEQDEPFPCSPV